MNYYEAQDLAKKLYPNQNVQVEFDASCIHSVEFSVKDSKLNPMHHVEYRKVKVTPHVGEHLYLDILPHRNVYQKDQIMQILNKLV